MEGMTMRSKRNKKLWPIRLCAVPHKSLPRYSTVLSTHDSVENALRVRTATKGSQIKFYSTRARVRYVRVRVPHFPLRHRRFEGLPNIRA
jgi:hypothetical protein